MEYTLASRNPLKRPAVALLRFVALLYPLPFLLMVPLGLMGYDSHAYWSAWMHGLYVNAVPDGHDAFLYSPAFAEVIRPLTLLPWPAFCGLWMALIVAIYAWLLAPVDPKWRILWMALVVPDVVYGNVFSLFALVLVLGVRYPALWAFPLLTKITPGVGVIWFALRRDWRRLTIALGTTALLAGVSLCADPHLWEAWIQMMVSHGGYAAKTRDPILVVTVPLFVRLPIAFGLAVYAARKNRYPLLAPAMMLATPVFGFTCLAILAAIPRLREIEGEQRRRAL